MDNLLILLADQNGSKSLPSYEEAFIKFCFIVYRPVKQQILNNDYQSLIDSAHIDFIDETIGYLVICDTYVSELLLNSINELVENFMYSKA